MCFDSNFLKGVIPNGRLKDTTSCVSDTFVTDIYQVKRGDFFVALVNSSYDGHDWIDEAVKRGATGFIIEQARWSKYQFLGKSGKLVFGVESTRDALFCLAAAWRSQFSCPVIGITGSVGKTSTKEILRNIFNVHGMHYFASENSSNDAVDVALNLLRMNLSHEVVIFEMTAKKRGEMAQLAKMVTPTHAIIANIGHSHMEGLGSLNDVALEQRDIFSCFNQDSIGIVNGDLPMLGRIGYPHPVIKFGSKTVNQVQARKIHVHNVTIKFILKLYKKKYSIILKNTHKGTVFNALAASSVAYLLGIDGKTIVRGIEIPTMIVGGFEHRNLLGGKGVLVNDCHGTNPEGMKASLLAFGEIESRSQKIIVLGDMHELGVNSPFWHRQLGRFLKKIPSINHIILVGDMVKWTKKILRINVTCDLVSTWEEAVDRLRKRLLGESSLILVKGSSQLDHLVDYFAPKIKSSSDMSQKFGKNDGIIGEKRRNRAKSTTQVGISG